MPVPHRLYLLRHAKSSWDAPALGDHERPLSPAGEQAAREVAAYLQREKIQPALVLCSTAKRARQTVAALGLHTDIRYEPGLYGADVDDLVARARVIPAETTSAMLVGHNPGLHELAVLLAGKGAPAELARLRHKLATGVLACLSFSDSWHTVAENMANLDHLFVPGGG